MKESGELRSKFTHLHIAYCHKSAKNMRWTKIKQPFRQCCWIKCIYTCNRITLGLDFPGIEDLKYEAIRRRQSQSFLFFREDSKSTRKKQKIDNFFLQN